MKALAKFRGIVIHGTDIGGKFGIATANLSVAQKPNLDEGVYFVLVETPDQKTINGIMHFGSRQTFGGDFSIEVHLLDFAEDLYGQTLSITVLKFRRSTQKFRNADELFTQIELDINKAHKFFLRREVKQTWEQISEDERQTMAQKVIEELSKLPAFMEAQSILTFAPLDDEIPYVQPLMQTFPEKKYYFPKVEDIETRLMNFYESNYSDLTMGAWNIMEPKLSKPWLPKSKTIVLVPAVAIDQTGNRLGRGFGFYDRWIERHPDVFSICVMPNFAVREQIPTDELDKPVEKIIRIDKIN